MVITQKNGRYGVQYGDVWKDIVSIAMGPVTAVQAIVGASAASAQVKAEQAIVASQSQVAIATQQAKVLEQGAVEKSKRTKMFLIAGTAVVGGLVLLLVFRRKPTPYYLPPSLPSVRMLPSGR